MDDMFELELKRGCLSKHRGISRLLVGDDWLRLRGENTEAKSISKLGEMIEEKTSRIPDSKEKAYTAAHFCYHLFSHFQKQANSVTFISFEFAVEGTKKSTAFKSNQVN